MTSGKVGRPAPGKRTGGAGFVETRWRPFTDLAEKSRLRRGKALAKQGAVCDVECRDGFITAVVRTPGPVDSAEVRLPAAGWWKPRVESAALWLARRPDWLAALLAGKWDSDLIAFLDEHQAALFPLPESASRMVTESSCTCADPVQPCVHVIATAQYVVQDVEAAPLHVFRYVGVAPQELLDEVHRQTARLVASRHSEQASAGFPAGAKEQSDGLAAGRVPDGRRSLGVDLWPEEQAAFRKSAAATGIHHVIAPKLGRRD